MGLELIVMCYEQAIRSLKEAREHYQNREYIEKGKSLQRAIDIISELKCSLDFDKGGEIAQNLDSIYNFLIKTLMDADIHRRLEDFDHAVAILEELRDAWEKISKQQIQQDGFNDNKTQDVRRPIWGAHAGVAA